MKQYKYNEAPNSKGHDKISHLTPMRFYIKTYGCQMNVADTDRVREILEPYGYTVCDELALADIVFINTCTVRQHAEDRAVSNIGRLKKWKEKYKPDGILVILGCVVERLGESLKNKFPFIDLLISSKSIPELPHILKPFLKETKGPASINSPLVTIMRGCSNSCSYCIVPQVRGPEKSRPVEEIIEDVHRRTASGVKEIMLLGQNVNSYHNSIRFPALLEKIARIRGIEKLSFMTSHPKDFNDFTIDIIARYPHISRTVHIPVQSGSDKILFLMNRGYTRGQFLSLLKRMRSRIPGIRITTDIIVGFPEEDDEDFQETVRLITDADLHAAYVFKFSPRKGTQAFLKTDTVPKEIKEERHLKILHILKERACMHAA